MTNVSSGFAGGRWEYVESHSSSPSPPRSPRPTFRPVRWGNLRRPHIHTSRDQRPIQGRRLSPDLESIWPAAESLPGNPPPMPALRACPRSAANAPTNHDVYNRHVRGDLDAGEGSTADRTDAGDGCTQSWVEAQRDVKLQMRKMGLEVSSSDDE